MDEVNITVIGAGVVGLAIAAELSLTHNDIVVLDKHNTFGQETSSRNSEVIHSGIYYPEGSLKARLCIEGSRQLYDICERYAIPHNKTGKLIVATDQSELIALEELLKKGQKNNIEALAFLEKRQIKKIEPNTNAIAAVYSPITGIIDSHSLMKYFYHQAEERGSLFVFSNEVDLIEKVNGGFIIGVKQEQYRFKSRVLINCAGLSSDHIAGLAGIDTGKNSYTLRYCKGSYFSYAKQSPVKTLVYPVPNEELVGLGVHATLDLGGRLRFGPDAEYIDHIDYRIDPCKRDAFYAGAAKIIPGLEKESLIPDMVGIRPKLYGPGEKARDFIITDETGKGLPGMINLIGIESPGLTASPAIGKLVANTVSEMLH